MKNNCYDLGTFQAFIDSELPSSFSEKVVKHVAVCEDCAGLLAETEEENAFAFSVMDAELNPLVPTERLRTKVFASIHEIESTKENGLWNRLVRGLGVSGGFGFAKPGLVAFASLALFVSGFAYILNFYGGDDTNLTAGVKEPGEEKLLPDEEVIPIITNASDSSPVLNEDTIEQNEEAKPTLVRENRPRKSEFSRPAAQNRRPKAQKAIFVTQKPRRKVIRAAANPVEEVVPLYGEESYIQTIATLDRDVEQKKDFVLRPKERVQFERNLALVDTAIKRMKREVRKNPRNKAAREILKASYQNKIDLLNSISEKDDLVAGL
ncbi:MAG: hypothetical protein HKN25_09505 [Pyrinomonadaceae bacterium]|nr:hypothetical protein [Pyrinomonadaceae bacterium]